MKLPSLLFACLLFLPAARAADYYIDPAGDDASAGTSAATPWRSIAKVNATTFQPGDNVRFKSGGAWTGNLWPKGSGSAAAQITLGAYGTGAKPLIDAAGSGSAIYLENQEYWTIDGMEVTNWATASGMRWGIRVLATDGTVKRNIRVLNNTVRDIYGIMGMPEGDGTTGYWVGGIYFQINEPGKADGVLIEGNYVRNIIGEAISFWGEGENAGGGMNYANCSPNVVVRKNTVLNTSGDGILMFGTDNELVEYNEVGYVSELQTQGVNTAAAWPTRHVGGLWQYNHVHHTRKKGNDGTAFDNDGFTSGTTIFQYNVSHDNEGGFIMEYTWGGDVSARTIARYNISWNDARIIATNRNNALLHNNVFYHPGATLDVNWTQNPSLVQFVNNLFIAAGRTAEFSRQVFVSNNFSGGMGRPTSANGNVTTDPQFVSPNATGNLAGFILHAGSPARSSGTVLPDNGGEDFWGTTLPATAPHRGASQINAIADYTATPSFIHVAGSFTANIPGTAAFTAVVRDQNYRPISGASVAWSLVPATAGYSIHAVTGVVTIDSTAVPGRFAVVASSGALGSSFSVTADVATLDWNNSAATGKWNASDANWTGQPWTSGVGALFAHTSGAQTVTLEGALTARGIAIGSGSNNASYTFAGAAGSSLAADSFTVQGPNGGDPGVGIAALSNVALNVAGDLGVGRWDFVIGGTSAVTIGGQLRATSDGSGLGDWGRVTIQGSANVTVTGGVNGAGTAWGLTLNGGTLTTPSIRARELNYAAGSRLTFNGTTVVASQDNAAFVTVDDTSQAYLGAGGGIFDTNGNAVGIGMSLTGGGGLAKQGAGTLTLTGANSFTGSTAVNAGTLALQGAYASSAHAIASGAVLELSVASGQTDFAATAFSGAGTLRKTGAGGAIWGPTATSFALGSGALIDVQSGSLTGGSYANENWSANLADLNVAGGAAFHGVEANVRMDALSGAGTITSGYSGAGYAQFTFGVDGGSGTFGGVLADGAAAGNFVKTGTGTQTLSGANTYTGATTIEAGKLALGGSLASSAVTASGGTFSPVGNASTTGGVSVPAGGRFEIRPGTDTLTVGGSVTLGGALDIVAAPGLAGGATLTIVDKTSAGAVSGTFSGKPEGSAFSASGYVWLISYAVGDGNDIALTLATPQQLWRFTHFGTVENTGAAADTFDVNGDGESNLMEFATAQNPAAATTAAPAVVKNGATLELTYTRANAAMADGVTFTVEWRDDLAAGVWSGAGVSEQILADNGTVQSVRASVAAGSGTKRFLHLEISKP